MDSFDKTSYHTPILVSSQSLIKDNWKREKYIDNCWLQMTWSAIINPKGGWFCEVAGAFSMLLDGPLGRDIEEDPEWGKKG